MVSINYSAREVCCKIVYYGPGLSGKTTNLQYVHKKVPGNTRGDLISLATEADRTLYFDFLPINIGTINGFAAKFQLYTVPGQVYYNATRKLVLRGVDGIVFVADSQPDKMDENIESLANLGENLIEYGYDINEIPLVLQYNKRDLPGVLSVEELNAQLNPHGVPTFEASATTGKGVFDTLKLIIRLVLDKAKGSGTQQPKPVATASPAVSPTARPVVSNMPNATPAAPSPSQPAPAPPAAASEPGPQIPASPTAAPKPEPKTQPAPMAASQSAPPVTSVPPEPQQTASQVPVGAEPLSTGVTPAPQTTAKQDQFRPYPGGSTGKIKQPGVAPSGIVPAPPPDPSYPAKTPEVTADKTIPERRQETVQVPTMAPSQRRKAEKKKRGFFKRLFGIK